MIFFSALSYLTNTAFGILSRVILKNPGEDITVKNDTTQFAYNRYPVLNSTHVVSKLQQSPTAQVTIWNPQLSEDLEKNLECEGTSFLELFDETGNLTDVFSTNIVVKLCSSEGLDLDKVTSTVKDNPDTQMIVTYASGVPQGWYLNTA